LPVLKEKSLRLQGTKGFIEWQVNVDSGHDAIRYAGEDGKIVEELVAKTRPDDFRGELDHLGDILVGSAAVEESPLALAKGLDTMLVVAAAHLSSRLKKSVRINYEAGCGPEALQVMS